MKQHYIFFIITLLIDCLKKNKVYLIFIINKYIFDSFNEIIHEQNLQNVSLMTKKQIRIDI